MFLSGVLRHGRIHELFLVIGYKLAHGAILSGRGARAGHVVPKANCMCCPGKSPDTRRVKQAMEQLKKP